jgi:uncharacterized protein
MAVSFLTAEWRDLAVLNWQVPPALLASNVPPGTQLDAWNGRTFVSLVGFRFLKTRVLRVPVPFHVNFPEVNLRFYVTRTHRGEVRRGVAFIKEIVSRACIARVARRLYNENYVAAAMSCQINRTDHQKCVRYNWTLSESAYSITARAEGSFQELSPGSEQEFILEHYWGYARQPDGRTAEYQVRHPNWRAMNSNGAEFTGDAVALYGPELGRILLSPPTSAFLVEGSEVEVGFGNARPAT